MSNERIDLTQFEGMIGGPWLPEWLAGADTDNEEPSAAIHTEDYGTIAQTFYRDWDKPYEATTKAIAAVPDLIAELKRCYDLIDCLEDEIEFVVEQIHRPITGGLEWYEVRNNILNQLVTNANSSTIRVLEALKQSASE